MKLITKILASILVIALFQGCSESINSDNSDVVGIDTTEKREQPTSKIEKVEKNLISKTEFHLKTVENGNYTVVKEGSNFTVQNIDSTLVLFDFFTTWCPACRSVSPHLANIQAKYPKEMLVLGILIEEDKSDKEILAFKKKYKADYPIANSTGKESNYANFKLSNDIAALLRQPRSFPIPLLVMFKNGEYFTHYIGAVPEEMIESDIKEALNLRGDN